MRRVELGAIIRDTAADQAYQEIARFDRFPDLAPHVQSTTVHASLPEPIGRSSWELHFRSGLLRWTEEERYRQDEGVIEFEQLSGDFDEFNGTWKLTQTGPDATLHFSAEFDFGIPSLEGILDPIAERVIKETIAWVVVGMFENVDLEDSFELVPITTPGM